MIRLYDYVLSADCYSVRLLLDFLALEYERVGVDVYPGGEHETEAFRRIHPLGRLPVLDDAGFFVRDTNAILVYVASVYDASGHWYPRVDARRLAETSMWLEFARDLAATVGAARCHQMFDIETDIERARSRGHARLHMLDEHLWLAERRGEMWLCEGQQPGIGDLACFAQVALCEDGGLSRSSYPAMRRWIDRVRYLPRFQVMPGILAPPMVVG